MLKRSRSILAVPCALLVLVSFTNGCGVYSFSGSALSSKVETVTVQRFPNNADLVNPNLSQLFTQKLRRKILQDTNLDLVDQGGDLVFSGSITKYKVSVETVQRGQQATSSELNISIKTQYKNKFDKKKSFNKTFSASQIIDQNESLRAVEDQKVEKITDQIIQSIFNDSINNW